MNRLIERLDALDLDNLEQFLSRNGEMLTEGVVDLLAGRLDRRLEQVGDERQTAAAAGAGLGAEFDFLHGTEVLSRGWRRKSALC